MDLSKNYGKTPQIQRFIIIHYPYQMAAIVYMWVYPIFRHTHMMKTARRQSKVDD